MHITCTKVHREKHIGSDTLQILPEAVASLFFHKGSSPAITRTRLLEKAFPEKNPVFSREISLKNRTFR